MTPAFIVGALLGTSDARALGVGSTAGVGVDTFFGNDFFRLGDDLSTGGFAPTLDLHPNPVHIQIHVLEFTDALINDSELFVGANMYFDAASSPVAGAWSGVVQPGFGVDVYGDVAIAMTGQCRLGTQAEQSAGFGVYVTPAAGIVIDNGDAYWVAGGSLQFSAWFGS